MTLANQLLVASTAFASSGLLALLILPVLRRHAMDVPNARSSHNAPIPRGGGVAVVVALVGSVALLGKGEGIAVPLVGVVLLAALGLVDDLRGLRESVRFGAQVVVSVGLAYLFVNGWAQGLPVVTTATLVGAFWLTAFTNAFNFMDGINGISGVTASLAAGWYLWLGHQYDLPAVGLLAAGLLGAAAGFLPLNFPRARLFLGDVGSYGVGVLLGSLAMLSLTGGAGWLLSVAPLLVYSADTGWTLARRMHRREKWWRAHRENVYQRLTASGANPSLVTVLVGCVSLVVCLLATLDQYLGISVVAVLAVLTMYLASPNLPIWRRE